MRLMRKLSTALLLLAVTGTAAPARAASDVDGPDCGRAITDFGDAPEDVPILGASSLPGHFPTCLAPGAPGTQELSCAPRSTPPGPTGYMRNSQGAATYWLGCYGGPFSLSGIDSEPDGKVSLPPGPSACSALPTDCALTPFLAGSVSYGQDECRGDDGDVGVFADLFAPCGPGSQFGFTTTNCGPPRQVYLNALVDLNLDGDWNDVVSCGSICAYEWVVKNFPVSLASGCEFRLSPLFLTGPMEGTAWMRVSLTDGPVDDDYPWAGSALRADGSYAGGETEDYLVSLLHGSPTRGSTWGRLKVRYH